MRAKEFIVEYKNIPLQEFNGLNFRMVIDNGQLFVNALDPTWDTELGHVTFNIGDSKELDPQDLFVKEKYRNQGVAKTMYDFVKSKGYKIVRSWDQTDDGAGFWDKHRGEDVRVWEDELDEAPLPPDWDLEQFHKPSTTFKSRLAYALERAKKLGTGSSRVAMTIEYEGRPTVLKVAKNQKGLAQNSVEASVLSDGYASQLGIMIPIIDYDEQNRDPVWIHTEMAQKATDKQLCSLIKCRDLWQLVRFAESIVGRSRFVTPKMVITTMRNDGASEEDIEICTEYANKLADLSSSYEVELGDFSNPRNWGIYQGRPVVIDVGLNSNVFKQYYR